MVLRNIAPREGTETHNKISIFFLHFIIKKYSSPRGDGNKALRAFFASALLRNIAPREGTETE